jgi:hypothetical protein
MSAQADPSVELIRRALLHDSVDVRDAGNDPRQEAPGTAGTLHAGVAAAMWADRGQGKSSAALVLAASHAAAGGRSLYLDRENQPELSKARAQAITSANGFPDVLEDETLVIRHYPAVALWEAEDFAEAVAGLGFTGVVYDSLREFLGQLALDPDAERDITRFFTVFVTPLLRRGLWVLALDNVGHAEKGRPKGSATKLDACAQGYQLETTSKFGPERIGALRITCKRSRYGDEDREWTMRLGGGLFEVPHTDSQTPDAKRRQAAADQREQLRLVAVKALTTRAPQGRDDLIAAVRAAGLALSNRYARELLADLSSDPASGITHTPRGYQITGETLQIEAPPEGGPEAPATPPGREIPGHAAATLNGATPQSALASQTDPAPDTPAAPRPGRGGPHGPTPIGGARGTDEAETGRLTESEYAERVRAREGML